MECVSQASFIMDQILDDRTVPKNIRDCILRSRDMLITDSDEIRVRVNAIVQMLDEITGDPNLPIYTRTQIWNIVSILEGV